MNIFSVLLVLGTLSQVLGQVNNIKGKGVYQRNNLNYTENK